MKRYLLIGLAAGTLALVLAGGAVLAGPSLDGSAAVAAAQPTPAPTTQPSDKPKPGRTPRQGDGQRFAQGNAQRLALLLGRATADVSGIKPQDVLAEVRAGKSLAQIAQEHGKTADDILAKLRELGQQRLDKALDKAKELIDKPGMGRGQGPNDTRATTEPST